MVFRIIKFAFQNFYRNFWLAVVTITMLTVTLFSVTTLLTLNVISNQVVKSIENKIDISVYFKPQATDRQILKVKVDVENLPEVKQVTLISKQEALKLFEEKYKNNKIIISSLKALNTNPLSSLLIIKAKSPEDYPQIIKFLDQPAYSSVISKKDFNDHKIVIQKIIAFKKKAKEIGFFIILLFSAIAALIVFNTVRIAIYTHKDEIMIMRLVGASNWFIRAPFLFEQVFYAFVSCLLLISIYYPLLKFLQPHLNYFLGYHFDILAYFQQHFFSIFGLQFLAVAAINILSSFMAMKKYLRA